MWKDILYVGMHILILLIIVLFVGAWPLIMDAPLRTDGMTTNSQYAGVSVTVLTNYE